MIKQAMIVVTHTLWSSWCFTPGYVKYYRDQLWYFSLDPDFSTNVVVHENTLRFL